MLTIKDRLYKNNGEYFDIKILTSEPFKDNIPLKAQVHKTIGNYDLFEWLGVGATSIRMQLCFLTEEEFEAFKFFALGVQMTLVRRDFRNVIVNIVGDLSIAYTYYGYYVCDIEFTTAKDPLQSIDFYINVFTYDVGSKKTLLNKLQIALQKIISFVGNVTEKIGAFISSIEAVTALINNIAQALASSQSILTAPLNTIKRSGANITDAISTITQTLQNIPFIIKTAPTEISSIFTNISAASQDLFNVFSAENPDEEIKMNLNFGCDTINLIYNADFDKDIYGNSQNVIELRQSNDMLKILFLCSLIANLEEKISEMGIVNLLSLNYYKNSFEKAYLYITASDVIDSDLRRQLDLCKIRFFRTYNNLYQKAIKVREIDVKKPTSLHSIVYNVNGNLDFFDETMQLNNIVNAGFVSGKILVLYNG